MHIRIALIILNTLLIFVMFDFCANCLFFAVRVLLNNQIASLNNCEIPEQTHVTNHAVKRCELYCKTFLDVISDFKSLAESFDLDSPAYSNVFDDIEDCMHMIYGISVKLSNYRDKIDDEWEREIDLSMMDIEVNISFDIHAIISAFRKFTV